MTQEPARPPQDVAAKPARKPATDKELEPLRAGNPGQGKIGARVSEPAAVILASDLARWILAKVGKFPRHMRYGLGARIESAHLDVLDSAALVACSRATPE